MTERYTAAIRHRLADLHGLHQQTQAVERKILESAEQRLDVVNAEVDKLAPRALTDDAAAERYQALILERGRLHQVIATAKEHLK